MMMHAVPIVNVVMVMPVIIPMPVMVPMPVVTIMSPVVPVMVMPHHIAPAFRPGGGRRIRALGRGRWVGRRLGKRWRRSEPSRDGGGCQ
jgi:hypothetical protein